MKVLVIDDEPTILETIDHKFRREGFTVFCAESAEEGMRLFRQVKPDILLLDVMLPNRSGLDLCRAIRKTHQTPIIFLTARADDQDRIAGFDVGADDYVVKPFNLTELVARVRAVMRRSGKAEMAEAATSGNLVVDPKSHCANLGTEKLDIAPKEFALLYFLMSNAGQVFSREQLLDRVWGQDAYVNARTVDVHIRWLREKIEENASNPKRIVTVRGIGYKFTA